MAKLDLTDDECAAVVALVRRTIAEASLPFAPRLRPLKSALAKLEPQPVKPHSKLPPLPPGRWWGAGGKRGG